MVYLELVTPVLPQRLERVRHNSIVAVTGTWSDILSQPLVCFVIVIPDTQSAIAGPTQLWKPSTTLQMREE
jgi:hypothetical protein